MKLRILKMMSKYGIQNQECEEAGEDDKQPINLCDLPTEILEKIIGNINIRHHNHIRATSRRMKDVSDMFVMHEFQKALNKNLRQDPNSAECSFKGKKET